MTPTITATLIWLLPFVVYLVAFSDSPKARLLWGIVTLVFSWAGLIARLVYGLLAGNRATL